jgi:hypothetical protein
VHSCKDTEIFNLGHNFEECSLLEFFSLLFPKTRFVTQPCGTSQRLLLVQAETVTFKTCVSTNIALNQSGYFLKALVKCKEVQKGWEKKNFEWKM